MITRPLDLASKLRPEPRSLDWLFFVNVGLIVFFFSLFSSKFVLAPSLGVNFHLPEAREGIADAQPATHHVRVTESGQIFVEKGSVTLAEFRDWVTEQIKLLRAEKHPSEPVLLVQAETGVPMQVWTSMTDAAQAAGFRVRVAVDEPRKTDKADPGRR